MKLYVLVARNGWWNVETARGRRLYEGWVRVDGSLEYSINGVSHTSACGHEALPDAIESAVRQSWVSGKVVTVDYTPAVVPRLGA